MAEVIYINGVAYKRVEPSINEQDEKNNKINGIANEQEDKNYSYETMPMPHKQSTFVQVCFA